MVIAVLGLAIPSFWLGANLIWVFAVKLHWFPAFGYIPISEGIVPWIKSITLPSISVGFISAALIARMTRASMLEVLREDYVRTARAKGLGEQAVLLGSCFQERLDTRSNHNRHRDCGVGIGAGGYGGRLRHTGRGTADSRCGEPPGLPRDTGCHTDGDVGIRTHQPDS